jgi:hypothetical protein
LESPRKNFGGYEERNKKSFRNGKITPGKWRRSSFIRGLFMGIMFSQTGKRPGCMNPETGGTDRKD